MTSTVNRDPQRPRRSGWTGARVGKTLITAALAVLACAPLGIALGAWAIFQPARAPMIGPIPAYLVAGGLLCIASGWYAGYRKREAEQGRLTFGYWPTYVLAAFAAGAFAIWSAHMTASVHTPEVSSAAAANTPATTTTTPTMTGESLTCAQGSVDACSNVLTLVQNTMDGFAGSLKTTCQAIVTAAANPQTAGWSPPRQLVGDCTFWLYGSGSVKGLDGQKADAHRWCDELAVYAGWPPVNR